MNWCGETYLIKKIIFIIISFLCFQFIYAQDSVSVEKSLIGISINPFGTLSFNYETKLAKEWTLLSNINVYYDYDKGRNFNSKGYQIGPFLGLEPRWYYNLDRRTRLSKNTQFNTGNYWSLGVNYAPKIVLATNQSYYEVANSIFFLPGYGIRRNISKKLYFDGSLFSGYAQVFGSELRTTSNQNYYFTTKGGTFYVGFKLRVGLNFIPKK